MKQLFNICLLVLLVPALVSANIDPKFNGKYTKEKKLKKEFAVNAEAGLTVDNSYGNIDIVTWNENRIVIEVHIRTNGNDEERVQEKLDNIDVDFSGSASKVTAKTIFKDRKNSSWSFWGNNNNKNVHMEINYTIKMPVTNSVDLNNDYGSININEIKGNAKINCDYGQLNLGRLLADNNYLNFDYTKNSTISYMKSGKINADYSSFTLDKVEYLELNADYTNSEVNEVGSINYNNDYGKLNIGKVGKLLGRGDYIPLRVDVLTESLNVNTDYGSVTVDRMKSSVKDVTIDSDYAGVKLYYDSDANFNFYIDLSYAGLNGEEDLEITKTSKDYSSKTYSGYYGRKDSGNTININSGYGGVTLKKL
ncbi:hypothetical protein KXJ69_07480 [Aureisphaera sp. CAU 1614]|uniref:Adhesin domain-containing protein n=1 Tax=Halomarinibacterium sedimenti TaxID=2857106 RepID=A0A9X1FNZ4_9FLAO|nr:hypothetical protein [Halomarinibacterium sedimenti]MBW2937941.1 hypothetical protein [Halomarinibacterium sedimenti]